MTKNRARYGWESDFPSFSKANARIIRGRLCDFIRDASIEQIRAWDNSIPVMQREVHEILDRNYGANAYAAILEYELPMESRRPDVILLVNGAVIVLELKGKLAPSQADLDQASAYGRDLKCYHRECAPPTQVHSVLVPMLAKDEVSRVGDVTVAGPDALDALVSQWDVSGSALIATDRFLADSAYRPLPTIVQAARELMASGTVRPIHRARAATDPALQEITRIIHEAAATKTRRLILLTGVPGAGKTLVGLQAVHAHFLDDLAIDRGDGKPTAPAVFLSGNGPLVEVLQYELRGAGGGGRTFVRGVKDYVKRYSRKPELVPPEHVLVFDEAQRAFDAEQVREKHSNTPGFSGGKSEPEHFIEFAERIPEWCVVIGLIGSGQEIHVGEEAGLVQWRHAIEGCRDPKRWSVHLPPGVTNDFRGFTATQYTSPALSLDTEIRFHAASVLHEYVASLLSGNGVAANKILADQLEAASYHLRITRDLDVARDYLWERYAENRDARFGLIASSKDKDLVKFGIPNDFQSTKRISFGPWYGDAETDPGERSCRCLKAVITEFGAQGLELDAALVAWGTDFMRLRGRWSNHKARGYLNKARVKNPFQIRMNAYRVLLTRGRDANVVFVPPLSELDETYHYLVDSGFLSL